MAMLELVGERVAGGFRFRCHRCGMDRVDRHEMEHHYCEVSEPRKFKPPAPARGPGTELKKLLKIVGITASPNCSCNARARTMDANGCEWCEANLDQIVGWLREEAAKRSLPFLDAAGRVLVRRAISNARKEAARATQASNAEGSEAKTR
jgi:hypothetical protein